MALVVEDGTGKIDAESYLSVNDANAHHTAHGNAGWTGTDAAKEAALRKATLYLDGTYGTRWPGVKLTEEQALLWPRSWGYDREGYALADDAVPVPIEKATAELALRALTTDLAPDVLRDDRAKRVKVGPIEEEYGDTTSETPAYAWIDKILAPLFPRPGVLVRG